MGRVPAVFVALTAIVAGAGGLALLGGRVFQVRDQLAQSRQEVATLTSQSAALTQQLESFQASRKQLEERVASLRTQLTGASSELEQAHQNVSELQARYDRFEQERKDLQTQVSSLTGERDQLHTKLTALDQEKADLTRSVGQLRQQLTRLKQEYRVTAERVAQLEAVPQSGLSVVGSTGADTPAASSSKAVELPPIIVRDHQTGASGRIRGRVVDVNTPDRFVIVDKGSADGVQTGMVFDILRGGDTVGHARVVRVRPQLSACDILRSDSTGFLQVGDLAIQSGS